MLLEYIDSQTLVAPARKNVIINHMARKQTEITNTSLQELVEQVNEVMPDKSPGASLSADDLSKLEGMSREELIALYRLLNANKVHYSLLTKAEKREAMKLKVYSIAMDSENEGVILKAANDWLDREDGKAIARISQDVNVSGTIVTMSGEQVQSLISGWIGKRQQPVIEHQSEQTTL